MDNSTLLIILVIILIFVLSNRLIRNKVINNKIVDKFSSGNLLSSNQQVLIRNTIDDLVNRRFSNLKISEASITDELNEDISTFHMDLDAPLGMISYFYGDPNPEGEVYWKECNGEQLIRTLYPDFFELYEIQNNNYNLPNIVGRTIIGAGQINSPNTYQNTSSNYGSDKPFHHNQSNILLEDGQTGGYDVCPPNDVQTLSRASANESNPVSVCTNMSNMPPHIYMTAWMKVKNKKFKISF
jgi:hypothetical protein